VTEQRRLAPEVLAHPGQLEQPSPGLGDPPGRGVASRREQDDVTHVDQVERAPGPERSPERERRGHPRATDAPPDRREQRHRRGRVERRGDRVGKREPTEASVGQARGLVEPGRECRERGQRGGVVLRGVAIPARGVEWRARCRQEGVGGLDADRLDRVGRQGLARPGSARAREEDADGDEASRHPAVRAHPGHR
jgi:hypothetical protein